MNQITTETVAEKNQEQEGIKMAYPNVKQGWGILGLYLAITVVFSIPISIVAIFGVDIQTGPFLFVNYAIPLITLILITQYWWKKNPKNQVKIALKPFPVTIIPVVFVLTLALGIVNNGITGLVPMPDFLIEIFKDALQINIWGFITIVLAASILEEILFRGIVLEGLLRNYNPFKAILWSSLFFGIFHMNPWQFVAAFFIGMAIGYLYWKTGSIWVGILMHAINNGIAFYLMATYPDVDSVGEIFNLEWIGSSSIFLMAIVIIWGAYKYFENYFSKKTQEE